MEKYVLIGGGLTSGQAALTLIKNGIKDPITLITNENYYPYERPGLSKGYLRNEEKEETLYTDNQALEEADNFKIIKNKTVSEIKPKDKTVTLDDGEKLNYTKLLIATGAQPRRLDIDDSKNPIYYFRNIDDVNKIKTKIKDSDCQTAIVIGASFIGMEVAASLNQMGLKVTILHRGGKVFEKLDSPTLSQRFIDYYKEKDVEFVFNDETEEITKNGIKTKKSQQIAGDIIIAGVGVTTNINLAQKAGLAIDDKSHGIKVNQQFLTSQPDIWAGGDIAYFPDEVSDKDHRLEHWDAANEQGQFIAHQMLGSDKKYKHLAYFFSDIFDLSFEFFGDSSQTEKNISVDHWTKEKASFGELYLNSNSQLVAAFTMNLTDEARDNIIKVIENKTIVDSQFIDKIK